MARPMTITEKILAAHAGLDEVAPGQLINCRLDLVLANDVTAPIAIREFAKTGVGKVWDPTKIALVPDHYTPNKDIKSAEQAKIMRDFVRAQGITHYYEIGCMGVEHALLPEQGVVGPGDVIIGADSHTCTYGALGAFATGVGSTDAAAGMATGEAWFKVPSSIKFNVTGELSPWVCGKDIILHIIGMIGVDGALYQSMEFTGDTIAALGMDDRMTICNMAIEAGGKSGIIAVDDTTRAYVNGRFEREAVEYFSDPDAEYAAGLSRSTPRPSFPRSPSRTCRATRARRPTPATSGSTRWSSAAAPTAASRTCASPRASSRAARPTPTCASSSFRPRRRSTVRRCTRACSTSSSTPTPRLDAHVRSVPRRPHGHPGGRGARAGDHQPQLRRSHGRPHERGLPLLAGRRRGKRRHGPHRAARRPGISLHAVSAITEEERSRRAVES